MKELRQRLRVYCGDEDRRETALQFREDLNAETVGERSVLAHPPVAVGLEQKRELATFFVPEEVVKMQDELAARRLRFFAALGELIVLAREVWATRRTPDRFEPVFRAALRADALFESGTVSLSLTGLAFGALGHGPPELIMFETAPVLYLPGNA